MDCSPPGSSVHGVLQAGILEGAAIHCLVTNYSPSAIILLLSSGFCGPGIRERSSGSVSGSRCRDCTRTRACVKHPLWTLAKPRLRLTWAGVSESWPGQACLQRGLGLNLQRGPGLNLVKPHTADPQLLWERSGESLPS